MKNNVNEAKKFSKQAFNNLARYIYDEYMRRKDHKDRKDAERTWKEVDRQIALTPEAKQREHWHPNFELPLQANALEALVADAGDLRFPGDGRWFSAHVAITDEYIEKFQKDVRFLNGDTPDADVFKATQTDLDAYLQGALMHSHRQYRFNDVIDTMDAEAFKYGTPCLRVRPVTRHKFLTRENVVNRGSTTLPMISPVSILHYFPDDLPIAASGQGEYLRPMEIFDYEMRFSDLAISAKKGETDYESINGGWMRKEVYSIEVEKSGDLVTLIEAEGDFVIDTGSNGYEFVPNAIVTIAINKDGAPKVIRARENPYTFNTVFTDTYFKDRIGVYGMSPLMKGESLQKAAQMAIEAVMKVSALQAEPPVSVNQNDPNYLADGLKVEPRAIWDLIKAPVVQDIGDLVGSAAVFEAMRKLYDESVGVNATRLGEQTKSHQTAFAVSQETSKGQNRTVKYVRKTESGILYDVLTAEKEIMRKSMNDQLVYIPEYGGFVTASKDSIPENAVFNIKGSATPQENQQKEQGRMVLLQGLLQIEPQRVEMGGTPLDLDKIPEEMLGQAFPDSEVKTFFGTKQPAAQGPEPQVSAPASALIRQTGQQQ